MIKRDRNKGIDLVSSFTKINLPTEPTRKSETKITKGFLFNYLVHKFRELNERFYLSPVDVVQRSSLKRLTERGYSLEEIKKVIDFIVTAKPSYISKSKLNGFSTILYFANTLFVDANLWETGNYIDSKPLVAPKVSESLHKREFNGNSTNVKKGVVIDSEWD